MRNFIANCQNKKEILYKLNLSSSCCCLYPLNRHPTEGKKVPKNYQPADRHNHLKKSSMHFSRDAFACGEAPSEMPVVQSLVGKLVHAQGRGMAV
jgi:hypothetical protein